jgi:hypothetical protein
MLRELVREAKRVFVADTEEHGRLRRRLATAILATLVVDAIGTAAMYGFEHRTHGSQITSVFTGFFWVTAQLLTVSSQMPNPLTTGGRIVDLVLEFWAILVVAGVTASFATFLQKK